MRDTRYSSPQLLEQAFYEALESKERRLLEQVWSDTNAVLIKASGEICLGKEQIIQDIEKALAECGNLTYRCETLSQYTSSHLAYRCVEESVYLEGDRRRQFCIVATNIMVCEGDHWKLSSRQMTNAPVTRANAVERRALPQTLVRNLGVLDLLR